MSVCLHLANTSVDHIGLLEEFTKEIDGVVLLYCSKKFYDQIYDIAFIEGASDTSIIKHLLLENINRDDIKNKKHFMFDRYLFILDETLTTRKSIAVCDVGMLYGDEDSTYNVRKVVVPSEIGDFIFIIGNNGVYFINPLPYEVVNITEHYNKDIEDETFKTVVKVYV